MKRVLLTGATGFVGRHCLEPLLARGFEIHGVSRTAQDLPGVTMHQADLLAPMGLAPLMAELKPTHLLHLAWDLKQGRFWDATDNAAWLEASLRLARAFHQSGGKRLVAVGSCAEYEFPDGLCLEAVTPELPRSLYGQMKLALSRRLAADNHGLSVAWGRLFHLYGPGEPPTRLVPSVILALMQGAVVECTHGAQVRDYLHVADAADALVALLDSPLEGAVNVASGEALALKDLLYTLESLLERPGLIHLGALTAPLDDPSYLVAGTRRLREELGWQPRWTLEAGLQDTIAWWQREGAHA